MLSRRTYLGIGAVLSGVALGGCTSLLDEERHFERKVELGRADPVSMDAEPERAYEYLEADDAVRIEYDHGGTTEMSFDEWGTRRAADAGAGYIREIIDADVWGSGIHVGIGVVVLGDFADVVDESEFKRDANLGVRVNHDTIYTPEGERLTEPDVDFEEVVNTVPQQIEVTMLFPEREYVAVLPVACHRNLLKEE